MRTSNSNHSFSYRGSESVPAKDGCISSKFMTFFTSLVSPLNIQLAYIICTHLLLLLFLLATSITSDPKCLHSLVSWAHLHAEACRSCPNLKEVLEDQFWGSVKAVWGCIDGHSYVMDINCSQTMMNPGHVTVEGEQPSRDGSHGSKTPRKPSNAATVNRTVQPSPATTLQTQHSKPSDISSPSTDGKWYCKLNTMWMTRLQTLSFTMCW